MSYNLLSYSQESDQPVWERSVYDTFTLATASKDIQYAPDDTETADVITLSTGNSARMQRVSVDPSTTYTYSVFLKSGSADIGGLTTLVAEGSGGALLRLNSTGTSVFTSQEYTTDWVRIVRTFTTGSDIDSIEVGLGISGDDQEGMTFIQWGSQLVLGSAALTYELTPTPVVTEPPPAPIPDPVPEPVDPVVPPPILPSFDDPFHEFYTEYSVYAKSLEIPSHMATYTPDNQEDASCISIITPEPDLGARKWTHNRKWITIGIFRDEGREPAVKPESNTLKYWVRSGSRLVITDSRKHQLVMGEEVITTGMNVSYHTSKVIGIISDYTFVVETPSAGSITGNTGTYQGTRLVNFHDEHVVFRLLPSFKLVTWSFVKSIFEASSPSLTLTKRTLFEITTGAQIHIPNVITKSVNYKVPNSTASESSFALRKRFNQRYDETGTPLKAQYDGTGDLLPPYQIDSKYKNNPYKLNNTVDGRQQNPKVFVYDFYGIPINEALRGPFFVDDLITRDERVNGFVDNIKRKSDNYGEIYYKGKLFDEFGNIVVGIQPNDAVTVRQNVQPIVLDSFNHPVKEPLTKRIL